MQIAVKADPPGRTNRGGVKGVVGLTLLALLALPNSSQGNEAALRKHVFSGGMGVTVGGLGVKYTYRLHESGPALSAGLGLFGPALALGLPVHRAQSEPRRELFVHAAVLQWQDVDSFGFDRDEGSLTWVIGLGPRLWPGEDSSVYIAGAGELLVSDEGGG